MASFGIGARLPGGSGFGRSQGHGKQPQQRHRARSSSSGAGTGSLPQQQGLLDNPWLKSGITSGSLSLAGDVLAQLISLRGRQQQGPSSGSGYDVARAARMGSFGLLFYGPYQYWWYGLLARTFPGTSIPMFATKVALNQLCLAPITITVAFTWNLALTRQLDQLPGKLRRDFVRTMINGWRFWIPAATINFKLVPLQYQVLYMSTCGMLWTGYLSYQSAAQAK